MPSLISPSLNPNSLYQNIHSGNKEKHNLLTSPVIIPEYNRKSSYPLSKTTQRHKYNKSNSIPKSSTSIPNSLNTNIVSPIFITNQNNNISSISHNYHLPGSIMPLTIGSPTKSNTNEPIYKDNDNNNLNRYHSQHNNNNIVLADHVHFGDEKSSLNEAQLYSFSSEKSKVLSISDTKNYKSIPLAYNIHGKSDDSGNTNKIDYKKDAFSPLVGPMITNPTNFMSSPSIKPIPQSMLPITPSVLMHLDNQLTSSITANNQQTTETTKQKTSSNINLLNINDVDKILNNHSLNFALPDMNVEVNMDTINNLNHTINNENTNNPLNVTSHKETDEVLKAIRTPLFINYLMKGSNTNLKTKNRSEPNNDLNKTEEIDNNPLLTPLILDGSALDIDHQTLSTLNNNLILGKGSNIKENDISSATHNISKSLNHSNKDYNTPISVSTIFNRYNNINHKSNVDSTSPKTGNSLNNKELNEALDKLISPNSNVDTSVFPDIDISKLAETEIQSLEANKKYSNLKFTNKSDFSSTAITTTTATATATATTTTTTVTDTTIASTSKNKLIISKNSSKVSKNQNYDKKAKSRKRNNSGIKDSKDISSKLPSSQQPTSNPVFLINKATTSIFNAFTSPSPTTATALTLPPHLTNIPTPEAFDDANSHIKNLPPPSISSNANIIDKSQANSASNTTISISSKSTNTNTLAMDPPRPSTSTSSATSISATSLNAIPSNIPLLTSISSKIKSIKTLNPKKVNPPPRITPLLPNKITSMDDAIKLASKSNYQNVLGGETTSLGLNPNLISGIEVRKTNHKNAEQKRRDSLKQGFENLKLVVPFISDKNPSKIMIITRSYEYICKLQKMQKMYEKEMKRMEMKEKLFVEKMKAKGIDMDSVLKEIEEKIDNEIVEIKESESEEDSTVMKQNSTKSSNSNSNSCSGVQQSDLQSVTPEESNHNSSAKKLPIVNKRKTVKETDKNNNTKTPATKKAKVVDKTINIT